MLTAYKALDFICKNKIINTPAQKQAREKYDEINLQCGGLTDKLCSLDSFSSILDILKNQDSSKDLIKLNSENALELVSSVNTQASEAVLDYLGNVKAVLSNDAVVSHLSYLSLIKLKMATCWLMANYLKRYESGLDLAEHIFQELSTINLVLSQLISKRSIEEQQKFTDIQLLKNLKTLQTQIHANFYKECKNFWDDEAHVLELKEFEKYISACKAFLLNPGAFTINDLVLRKRDDKLGLALYSTRSKAEDNSITLVAFPFNFEGFFNNYNPNQNRTTELELGGLAHAPVADGSMAYWTVLNKLISEAKSEFPDDFKGPINLIGAGFGLDGAIAQILSYKWAREHADASTRTYCLGTPPYVDANAARTIQQQPGHYAISFALEGDRYLCPSKLNMMIKQYSSSNFKGSYRLHYRDLFASDFYKHDKPIYLDAIKLGVKHAKMMFDLNKEIENLLKTTAHSSDKNLGANIVKLYAPANPNSKS